MMKTVALFCAFVALAVAQFPVSFFTLAPNTPQENTFAANTDPYSLHVYSLQLSESMAQIEIEFSETSDVCDYVLSVSGREVPCGTVWSTDSDLLYPCRGNSYSYEYLSSSTESVEIYPEYYAHDMYVKIAGTVYVVMTRSSTIYADDTCTYTINAAIASCPAGLVPAEGNNNTCYNLTDLGAAVETSFSPITADNEWSFYRLTIPANTGSVHIWGNITSDSYRYIYISQNIIPTQYSYAYDTYDAGTYIDTNTYGYDLWLFNPEAGYVYIGIDDEVTGGLLNVSIHVCPAGFGGWNCTYPVIPVTGAVDAIVNLTSTGDNWSESQVVYYSYTTAPDVNGYANFTAEYLTGDISVYYRKNAFSDDLDYNYGSYKNIYSGTPSVTFALTPADLATGGSYIFGFQNYDHVDGETSSLRFTTSSSSGSSTTGSVTGETTESTTGSSASSVAYCFALVALCVAALF